MSSGASYWSPRSKDILGFEPSQMEIEPFLWYDAIHPDDLPVDFIKIDGIFVKDMDSDSVNRAMVEAIHNLGRVMNIKTIAEFVGSASVKAMVKDLGVDYAQGYEISKPTPIANLSAKFDPSVSEHR